MLWFNNENIYTVFLEVWKMSYELSKNQNTLKYLMLSYYRYKKNYIITSPVVV